MLLHRYLRTQDTALPITFLYGPIFLQAIPQIMMASSIDTRNVHEFGATTNEIEQ